MLVCEAPAKTGTRAGLPARGTPAGSTRHYRAGEPPCEECRLAEQSRAKEWARNNRDRIAAADRRWYEAHREQALAYSRQFRQANPDYQRAWYQKNRQRKLEKGRAWVEANRERVSDYRTRWNSANKEKRRGYERRWREANRDLVTEYSRRRRARLRDASIVPFSREQLNARMAYWGFRCWMCGGPFESVDHVKPLAKGGAHILANLRPACQPCNLEKSDRWEGTA